MGGKQNWDIKPAQVYTTLTRLHESGLVQENAVVQAGGPEKRIYQITPAGREELGEWFLNGVEGEHQRDEFFIKLMLSLATREAKPQKVIQAQRAKLYRDLHAVTNQRQGVDPHTDLAHVLLLDKTVMHLEADLRWLDMIDARLDELKRQPLPQPEFKPRGRPRKTAG